MGLNRLTIAEARARLSRGEITARALIEDCLAAIANAGALNAVCHDTAGKARGQRKRERP